MRLDDERESRNIENRRGEGGFGHGGGNPLGGLGGGGGSGGLLQVILPFLFSRFGIVGVVLALGAFWLLDRQGLPEIAMPAADPGAASRATAAGPGLQDSTDRFVARVLATTEDSWGQIFEAAGQRYQEPTLVLFAGSIRSACGGATSAVGPFYCPADRKVYLDTSFFDELAQRFGAPGDFAAAYVIAHEVGHHVQNLLGTSARVAAAQRRAGTTEANRQSVRLELQADCYAGVWAAHNRELLDAGDFDEGVRAAQVIGDDTLQKQAQGRVVPDSFTHGTSAQRIRWLQTGFRTGDPAACDTFAGPYTSL